MLIWDTETKGFALRITRGGAKAFVLDYRAEGRQRRITIGGYPDWSVSAAREAAKAMKRAVDQGRDPMGERHAERAAPTISELWETYSREYLPRKAKRSQLDERVMWERLILPCLGKDKMAAVTHEQVEALHRKITVERSTPVRASRTIEVLRKALNWAVRRGWRADNPASGVHRNPEEKRQRYLTPDELGRLCAALDAHREKSSATRARSERGERSNRSVEKRPSRSCGTRRSRVPTRSVRDQEPLRQPRRAGVRSPLAAAPTAALISASKSSGSAARTTARTNSSLPDSSPFTSILPAVPFFSVMARFLSSGSVTSDITRRP